MLGDEFDLFVVLGFGRLNLQIFGDSLENEVLAQRRGGLFFDVSTHRVDHRSDLIVRKTTAPEFENPPLQFAIGLATHECWREIPVRTFGELLDDLLAKQLILVVFALTLQLGSHEIAKFGRGVEPEFGQLRIAETFHVDSSDFNNFKVTDHFLASKCFVLRSFEQFEIGGNQSTLFDTGESLTEFVDDRVGEGELLAEGYELFAEPADLLAIDQEVGIDQQSIAELCFTIASFTRGDSLEGALQLAFNFVIGQRVFRLDQVQTFPLGNVKLGTNFDLEFEGKVASVGQSNGSVIHVRFRNCGELSTFGDLLETVHHQVAFHLVGDGLFESGFEKLARDFSSAKPWQIRSGCDLVVRFSEIAIQFRSWNRDHNMPFASTWFVDLNLQIELAVDLSFNGRHSFLQLLKARKKQGHP